MTPFCYTANPADLRWRDGGAAAELRLKLETQPRGAMRIALKQL